MFADERRFLGLRARSSDKQYSGILFHAKLNRSIVKHGNFWLFIGMFLLSIYDSNESIDFDVHSGYQIERVMYLVGGSGNHNCLRRSGPNKNYCVSLIISRCFDQKESAYRMDFERLKGGLFHIKKSSRPAYKKKRRKN
jgi:hypothetical protein